MPLTHRFFTLEVADKAYVFIHSLKSVLFHGVTDQLHWVLQQLKNDVTHTEKGRKVICQMLVYSIELKVCV